MEIKEKADGSNLQKNISFLRFSQELKRRKTEISIEKLIFKNTWVSGNSVILSFTTKESIGSCGKLSSVAALLKIPGVQKVNK